MLEVFERRKGVPARDEFLASFTTHVPVASGATAPTVDRVDREGTYAIVHWRSQAGLACRTVLIEMPDGRWFLELGLGLVAPKPGCDPA